MKNTFFITWVFLMLFTLTSAFMAGSNFQYVALAILGLAFLKFMAVAFYFMELKRANSFWQTSLVLFLLVFMTIILIV
ncbi:hypothetical protein DHD05_19040 [Arenibacter sp. N53]|uniref:cytochrome C oxidase subunit IV family protein n=1 Tax=Arenibacter TaxID=178469 RepID=UPI000CD3E600|nr:MULTISPECIES: cytochrome C oxidase subunit IV family protein [Arenibacter]MCM4153693.1 hypothetical protein [Arenibacter sp. N53]